MSTFENSPRPSPITDHNSAHHERVSVDPSLRGLGITAVAATGLLATAMFFSSPGRGLRESVRDLYVDHGPEIANTEAFVRCARCDGSTLTMTNFPAIRQHLGYGPRNVVLEEGKPSLYSLRTTISGIRHNPDGLVECDLAGGICLRANQDVLPLQDSEPTKGELFIEFVQGDRQQQGTPVEISFTQGALASQGPVQAYVRYLRVRGPGGAY
jgi:hypothetical protein